MIWLSGACSSYKFRARLFKAGPLRLCIGNGIGLGQLQGPEQASVDVDLLHEVQVDEFEITGIDRKHVARENEAAAAGVGKRAARHHVWLNEAPSAYRLEVVRPAEGTLRALEASIVKPAGVDG